MKPDYKKPPFRHGHMPWRDEEVITEKGTQPLDELMERLKVTNQDLVKTSSDQLTYKVVGKARKGKKLNEKMQLKVLHALQAVRPEMTFTLEDLFNY